MVQLNVLLISEPSSPVTSNKPTQAVCKAYWKLPDVEAGVSHRCPSVGLALPGVPFIDKGRQLQELTAHRSICHIRVGVKIAGGLGVRSTVTGSGGSGGSVCAADCNMNDVQCEALYEICIFYRFCLFFVVFGAKRSFCTALYKDHLSIKTCGRCCCLCPWIFR